MALAGYQDKSKYRQVSKVAITDSMFGVVFF